MNEDKIIKFAPGQTSKFPTVVQSRDTIAETDYSGGGNNMDDFVKKHELEAVKNEILTEIKLLSKDVQRNQELSNEKFSALNDKVNWILGILAAVVAAIILKYFFNI